MAEFVAGAEFGPYRLVSRLGAGGMGEVWEAVDTAHDNRNVALKTVLRHGLDGPDFTQFEARFRRECALTARLTSPHIVPIHRYGEIAGRLFIDMALIHGIDLATLLCRTGPLPPGRAVSIIDQVSRALSTAHRAGMVHRDVKPSNILVSDDDGRDHVWLIDFGIAYAAGSTRITSSGAAPGSPAYIAPERFLEDGDHRVDIYSLACVLFETLTGERPFTVAQGPQLMYAHLHTAPPRASHRWSSVPPDFDDVIVRGMAKKADERYPDVAALSAAARAALASAQERAHPPPPAQMTYTGSPGVSPKPLSAAVVDRLLRQRIIVAWEEIDKKEADRIYAQMLLLAAEDESADISLYINSPGGSVTATMAIYDTIQFIGCDVATYAAGMAAGTAQLLLSAGARGKRYALPHAQIGIIPLAAGRPTGERQSDDIQRKLFARHLQEMATLMAGHVAWDPDAMLSVLRGNSNRWYSAAEAVAAGLVDHIVERVGTPKPG